MRILMVSWEYPPVVIGGLGRHVHHLSTALAAAGHEVVVLSRRPTNTDPSTHPSLDEINENVRVVAAAQDPHEFTFGTDMMAWTLAMGHAMVRAGLSAQATAQRRPVAARCGPRARLAGRPPGYRARGVLRRANGFHDPRDRGRSAFRMGLRSDQPAGARGRVVAGARIRLVDHLFGVDERGDRRAVRARAGRDHRDPQRHRGGAMAVRTPQAAQRSAGTAVRRPAGIREGRARGDRRAATDPPGPPRHHPDHRRRRHAAGLARRAGP